MVVGSYILSAKRIIFQRSFSISNCKLFRVINKFSFIRNESYVFAFTVVARSISLRFLRRKSRSFNFSLYGLRFTFDLRESNLNATRKRKKLSFPSSSSSRWNNYSSRSFYRSISGKFAQFLSLTFHSFIPSKLWTFDTDRYFVAIRSWIIHRGGEGRNRISLKLLLSLKDTWKNNVTYIRTNEFYIISYTFFFFLTKIYHINRYLNWNQ